MHAKLLELLACPCGGDLSQESDDGLLCISCGQKIPIIEGIARFPHPPHTPWPDLEAPSPQRFLSRIAPVPVDFLAGKCVLEAGGDGGTSLEVVASSGTEFVVCLSTAENLAKISPSTRSLPNVALVEGDLMHPPFRPERFDYLYLVDPPCDASTLLPGLLPLIRPGGHFSLWVRGRSHCWCRRLWRLATGCIRAFLQPHQLRLLTKVFSRILHMSMALTGCPAAKHCTQTLLEAWLWERVHPRAQAEATRQHLQSWLSPLDEVLIRAQKEHWAGFGRKPRQIPSP